MDITNEHGRTQRNVKANRTPAKVPANGQMRKQARKITQDVSQMGKIARDVAEETLGQLRESATEYKDQGLDKIQEVERTIEDYIRERPIKTILIAAGVGLLLGRFWMRR